MEDIQSLIQKALADNYATRLAMFEAIASQETVSFVGAGLSAPLRYPDWNGLIGDLTERANQIATFAASSEEILSVGEEIKAHFASNNRETEYYAFLARAFDSRPGLCTGTHRRLVRLPFRSFVTTNYDPCMEHSLCAYALEMQVLSDPESWMIIAAGDQNRAAVSKFLRSLSSQFQILKRHVAHIHGRYSDPRSIVLTTVDYERAYGISLQSGGRRQSESFTIHRQVLWALFATRRLIFIGCSMQDPYIQTLLNIVSTDLWEWETGNHFVILGLDKNNVNSVREITREYARYGMVPVFFDNFDESFSRLDMLLDEAGGYCKPNASSAPAVTNQVPITSVPEPDISPTAITPLTVPAAEWLDRLSERTAKELQKNED
jgi:hypothetical protein